jgi:hypothetical protein
LAITASCTAAMPPDVTPAMRVIQRSGGPEMKEVSQGMMERTRSG